MHHKKTPIAPAAVCVLFLSFGLLHNLDIWLSQHACREHRLGVILSSLAALPYISTLATWTGSHGGYGFYGPQVGSHYFVHFEWMDGDSLHTHHRHPLLQSRSAQLRYSSFLDMQEVWIPDEAGRKDTTMARAIVVSLSRNLASELAISNMHTRVSVLDRWRKHHLLHTYYYENTVEQQF